MHIVSFFHSYLMLVCDKLEVVLKKRRYFFFKKASVKKVLIPLECKFIQSRKIF